MSWKRCVETFGGYQCTCQNTSRYGENCTKGKLFSFTCIIIIIKLYNNFDQSFDSQLNSNEANRSTNKDQTEST